MLKFTTLILTLGLAAVSVFGQSQPTLRIQADDPNLPADLYYGNIKVKPLRLRPGTNQLISINDGDFFVSQHYVDFLSRFPDAPGMTYWTGQVASQCAPADSACILNRRVSVSAAFFIEQEFQATGSYVYRFYKGSLGRQPIYSEFVPDRRLVVGGSNLEANKAAFAEAWVARPEFVAKYQSFTAPDTFVDAVIATVRTVDGVDLSSQRGTWISELTGGKTKGQVVREIIDNSSFANAEYNPSFVRMQYFGYLKRDPDAAGEAFWLNVLNNRDANNFKGMVCSFLTSTEYQVRFDASATHGNSECSIIH